MTDWDPADFDKELHGIFEFKPPVSASKIQTLTSLAMGHPLYYKNVVYIIEKFVHKCPPEYKLAGLYVIDAISRAAFEQRRKREKDGATPEPGKFTGEEYLPRFEKVFEENSLFRNMAMCPDKDKVRGLAGLQA
ncbi:hypothetical protein BC936DRAFT_143267 [Jimgerdemannia flammicorona]|uniref:CID domain-containing protein n=1 Tax=Jimgerdemannia flammicorona TaxID=994334 RepID=A0A433DE62_9FUNG|nr:hypothetical protein BC936DRAFT_143267 [Jimgerdemannia flammicorona]